MRVLVCGGRNFSDYDTVAEWLIYFLKQYAAMPLHTTIISGHARGADKLGERFAKDNECNLLTFPADWDKYKKAAGHIRNQQMLDEGKPDLVIAFKGGTGTADMVNRSVKAGVRTVSIHKDGKGYTENYKDG